MSDVAIRAENLGKLYRIGERERYLALRDVLARALHAPTRLWKKKKAKASHDSTQLWALNDVSFEIRQGDVVGILGRNGAGKSTLLKILARVTKPTRGFADVYGRMGTLLEVGTGFHPELTGRENVFLSGAILGMRKAEIQRKFDEIVAFSEVEKFIDTPIKHYSSGMQMRLAFAVAAHLEPEILLVDEVLAVGDTTFQEKCLGKMQEVSAAGRTVVFVSHQLQAVSALTRRCILLESGRCVRTGETAEIITEYMASSVRIGTAYQAEPSMTKPSLVYAEPLTSRKSGIHDCGESLRFSFCIHTPMLVPKPSFSFQIFNSLGQPVVHLGVLDSEMPLFRQPGTYMLTCEIPRSKLYIGRYTITTHIAGPATGPHYESVWHICPFEVISSASRELFWKPGTCCYIEEDRWSVRKLSAACADFPEVEGEGVWDEIGVYSDSWSIRKPNDVCAESLQ
jgi:lipopolysaccharide transport system ATP-binding protein